MTDTPARQALPWVRGTDPDPAPVDADFAVADPALWGEDDEAVDSRGMTAVEPVHDTTVKPPQTPPCPRWPTADRARPLASEGPCGLNHHSDGPEERRWVENSI